MSIAGPTAALVTLLAATAPTPSRVTTPVDPVEIYGGEKIGSNEFRAVAAIEFDSVLCTGTVVSETLVLTAAHCLTSLPNVNDMRVVIGDSTTSPDAVAEVERYAIHPDFCDDPDTCEEDFYDFAYVVLKQQLPIAELPLVMSLQEEWDQTMFIDAPITLVGFGRASNGPSGYKRKVETTITAFSKSGVEFKAGGMGKDTCQGDSGGPAFVELEDGTFVVAGVTSRGFTCGDGGFYGLPYPALCWLRTETGVDLTRDECDACDCLETDPTRGEGCCAIARPRDDLDAFAGLAIVILTALRRRRDDRTPRAR